MGVTSEPGHVSRLFGTVMPIGFHEMSQRSPPVQLQICAWYPVALNIACRNANDSSYAGYTVAKADSQQS